MLTPGPIDLSQRQVHVQKQISFGNGRKKGKGKGKSKSNGKSKSKSNGKSKSKSNGKSQYRGLSAAPRMKPLGSGGDDDAGVG